MSVVFVDTETLGLDPDHHPIWEVALILPHGEEATFHIRVTPREVSLAHPKALEIGRFEERYSEDGALPPRLVAETLHQLIRPGDHLAGAVVSFDEERLRRLLWRFDLAPRWHYHLIDVEALAAGCLVGQFTAIQECGANPQADGPTVDEVKLAYPPWKSDDLSRAIGVDPDDFDRHTALGDARWAKAMYEAVMGRP